MKSVSHLPDPDNSVGDEDEKNNNRLDKGGGCLLSLLKQSQHLCEQIVDMTLADRHIILLMSHGSPKTFGLLSLKHVWEEKMSE